MTVVDTSVLIDHAMGDPAAVLAVQQVTDVVRVPAVVWVQFLAGVPAGKRQQAQVQLQRATHFVPFDLPIAKRALALQAELMAGGMRLSWSDLQVAATALHLDEPLLARDADFGRVPGLRSAVV